MNLISTTDSSIEYMKHMIQDLIDKNIISQADIMEYSDASHQDRHKNEGDEIDKAYEQLSRLHRNINPNQPSSSISNANASCLLDENIRQNTYNPSLYISNQAAIQSTMFENRGEDLKQLIEVKKNELKLLTRLYDETEIDDNPEPMQMLFDRDIKYYRYIEERRFKVYTNTKLLSTSQLYIVIQDIRYTPYKGKHISDLTRTYRVHSFSSTALLPVVLIIYDILRTSQWVQELSERSKQYKPFTIRDKKRYELIPNILNKIFTSFEKALSENLRKSKRKGYIDTEGAMLWIESDECFPGIEQLYPDSIVLKRDIIRSFLCKQIEMSKEISTKNS